MRNRSSLSLKLTYLIAVLGVIPLLLLSVLLYRERESNVTEMVTSHLEAMAEEIGREVERTVFSAFAHVRTLAENPILKYEGNSLEEKLGEMQKIQDFFNLFEEITLLDLDGVVLASTAYDYRGNWVYKDWFIRAKDGETVVSPVHVIPFPARQVVVVTAPITGDNGRPRFVIAGQVNMERIWEITDNVRLGETGNVFLLDKSGNLLAAPEKERLLYKFEPLPSWRASSPPLRVHWNFEMKPASNKSASFSCWGATGITRARNGASASSRNPVKPFLFSARCARSFFFSSASAWYSS
jgi:hypothetical protein